MSRLNVANFRHPDGTDDNINLTSTGRVGINESTPDRALHVNSANQNECAKFESTDTEVTLEFTDTTGTAALKCRNDFRFNTSSSTEICRIESGGNMQFNSGFGSVATAYGCRAWVNFNGTGTVAIRASGNVSSITDNGTGDYTVNFTTAMPDANYVVAGSTVGNTLGSSYISFIGTNFNTVNTTSSFRFKNYVFNASNVDNDNVSIAVIR